MFWLQKESKGKEKKSSPAKKLGLADLLLWANSEVCNIICGSLTLQKFPVIELDSNFYFFLSVYWKELVQLAVANILCDIII